MGVFHNVLTIHHNIRSSNHVPTWRRLVLMNVMYPYIDLFPLYSSEYFFTGSILFLRFFFVMKLLKMGVHIDENLTWGYWGVKTVSKWVPLVIAVCQLRACKYTHSSLGKLCWFNAEAELFPLTILLCSVKTTPLSPWNANNIQWITFSSLDQFPWVKWWGLHEAPARSLLVRATTDARLYSLFLRTSFWQLLKLYRWTNRSRHLHSSFFDIRRNHGKVLLWMH